MHNLDATFEAVSERQEFLRLLAGPQPFIPLTDPPSGPARRLATRAVTALGTWLGVTRPVRHAPGPRASA